MTHPTLLACAKLVAARNLDCQLIEEHECMTVRAGDCECLRAAEAVARHLLTQPLPDEVVYALWSESETAPEFAARLNGRLLRDLGLEEQK